MEINRRVQDVSQVFDRNWNVNKNNQARGEFLKGKKEHFNKMYNLQDKTAVKKEILAANSVGGQVKNLNERMHAIYNGNKIVRQNDFKNNFR